MLMAKSGDTVRVHYTGTLDDGTVFDSSSGRDPLEFVLGSGMVIPGFDNAITGMFVSSKKKIKIECAEAYGDRDPQRMVMVPKDQLPPDSNFQVGDAVGLQDPQGHQMMAMVADKNDEGVVLDMNHPLAGQDLTFELELIEIVG
jgi:FKBP-type peptidyl-prolyl cis-trans isomerase 2